MEVTKKDVPRMVSGKFANMGFVCALMVVLIHCPKGNADDSIGWWWADLVQSGVPFFFLSSGYFLAGHIEECGWWKCETAKRVRTLIIPFLFWNITYAVCSLTFRYINGTNPCTWKAWMRFVANAIGLIPFGGISMGALWFVKALFVLVLLAPLLKRLATPVGIVLLFILYALFNSPDPYEIKLPYIGRFTAGWLSFCGAAWLTLGIYLRRGKMMEIVCEHFSHRHRYKFMVLFLVCGGVFLRAILRNWSCDCAFSIAVIPCIMAFMWLAMPSEKWPIALISCAFPLYCLHGFAILFLRQCAWYVTMQSVAEKSVWIFILSFVLVVSVRLLGNRINSFLFGGR